MIFKKKGSIVEKIVIIVTSRIQGVINDKNGLLVISSYNEGIKRYDSSLSLYNSKLKEYYESKNMFDSSIKEAIDKWNHRV